jgi:hypothetical protein
MGKNKKVFRLGIVAYTSNPATWEKGIEWIMVRNQPREKVPETPSQPTSWAWWGTPASYAGGIGKRITV